MRSEGNVALSQLTLKMISCDLGTKSSLEPNCYFTCSLIYSQNPTLGYVLLVPPMPLTVTLAELDKSYVLVHCPVHCIASPPSEVPSGQVHQSHGFQNGNPLSTLPYPYSEHAYRSSESVRNTTPHDVNHKPRESQQHSLISGTCTQHSHIHFKALVSSCKSQHVFVSDLFSLV